MGKSWMIWENHRIHDIYQAQAAKIMRDLPSVGHLSKDA